MIKKCPRCNRLERIYAKGLCTSCYQYARNKKIGVIDCQKIKELRLEYLVRKKKN
jgi:hypothetical protein